MSEPAQRIRERFSEGSPDLRHVWHCGSRATKSLNLNFD